MPLPVISVRGLGKKYRLGATLGHDTLRDRIAHGCGDLLRRLRGAVTCHQSSVISDQSAVGPKSLGTELPQAPRSETEPTSPVQHSAFSIQHSSPPTPAPSPVQHSAFDIQHSSALAGATRPDEFWALRDVSFDVQQGEVVGIIGRNGAGKSTLLKILSQITEPTTGEVVIRGRVASLLEVGTGFHPELTGRENVFLNGAILGMSQAEIRRKFDEIVAFAEVERFLDTPVKRYSSGMYVRLAFAVAAHLEPEILIVDEVLAVGDAQFQKKCLGKMGDVARDGRTVLFVSHNMPAITNLCTSCFLLNAGRREMQGPAREVVYHYINSIEKTAGAIAWERPDQAPGGPTLRLHAVRIKSEGKVTTDVDIAKDVLVEIDFWNLRDGNNVTTSIHLLEKGGTPVLATALPHSMPLSPGLHHHVYTIPACFLNNISYSVNVFVIRDVTNVEVAQQELVSFTVHEISNVRTEYFGHMIGVVRPHLRTDVSHIGGLP